jgi:hypothetical protein
MLMTRLRRAAFVAMAALVVLLFTPKAPAHEFTLEAVVNAFVEVDPGEVHLVVRAPLYLFKHVRFPSTNSEIDIGKSGPAMQRALAALQQGLVITENGVPLNAVTVVGRLALPSDRSFETYEQAAKHVAEPIEADTRIVVDQGYVDAHLVYPTHAAPNAVFALRSTIAPELGDYLKMTVRYTALDGHSRAMVVRGTQGTVELNPSWTSAAAGFVGIGIEHIATGYDHLLFLLCLVIPLRGWRQLLTIVSAFTLAHSCTLIGSAFGLVPHGAWFAPLVEMCIAVSIVYTALENIIGVQLRRRILLSLMFGLVHGFAFSYALTDELQFAGTHLLVSLFAFNIGIEIGQIMALAVMLPALAFVTRHLLTGRVGAIILSALLAHVGWHWMEGRWDILANVAWPVVDATSVAALLAWAAGLVVLVRVASVVVGRLPLVRGAGSIQRPPVV